jgi:hypothetical protein
MAKKRNLKREKAERNREYAKQFQKSRARNGRRFRSAPATTRPALAKNSSKVVFVEMLCRSIL